TDGSSRAVAQRTLKRAKVIDQHSAGNLVLLDLGQPSKKELVKKLSEILKDPNVQYAVENIKIRAFHLPNDPEITKQWSVAAVRAAEAWNSGVGSRQVIVAVTDTGVDYSHTDIKDNLWTNKKETPGNGIDDDQNGYVDDVHGYDFRDNDGDPKDETSQQNPGHGTHCAGILGAVGDNAKGISGMSQRISIMASRFLGADGSGDLMGAVKSIDYATENGANVISASWGAASTASNAQPIIDAISRANDKGIIFVAAASNDGKNNDRYEVYPANTQLPNVITVAATTESETKPSWSNFGQAKVSLAAPGEKIYSTLPGDRFGELSGTSMATPLVSGLAGLLLAHNSDLKPTDVKGILQASGKKMEIETACNCRVDAATAVERVRGGNLTVIPQAATIAPDSTLQFSAWGGKGPYQFASSAENIASIDSKGLLTAKTEGEVTVTVSDSRNTSNQSLRIRVVASDAGGGGGTEDCPLGDPQICEMMCGISPDLPWCKAKMGR
ncbi:MAG: protease, partial [Proteobacteria bacterium]|nr:protease [Pseudomonadota bacterium]